MPTSKPSGKSGKNARSNAAKRARGLPLTKDEFLTKLRGLLKALDPTPTDLADAEDRLATWYDVASERRMGRPRKIDTPEDWEEFEQLCAFQATEEEIAAWFGCDTNTVNERCKDHYDGRTFEEVFLEKSLSGKVSLRRAQMQNALSGNPTMQIFLGHNLLGQRQKSDVTVAGPDGGPIPINATVQVVRYVSLAIPSNGSEPVEDAAVAAASEALLHAPDAPALPAGTGAPPKHYANSPRGGKAKDLKVKLSRKGRTLAR